MTESASSDSAKPDPVKPDSVKPDGGEACPKESCGETLDAAKTRAPEVAPCLSAKACGDEAHPYFNAEPQGKTKRPVALYVGMVIVVGLASLLYANKDLLIQPDALVMPEALDIVSRTETLEKRVAVLEKHLETVGSKASVGALPSLQEAGQAAVREGEVATLRDGLVGLTQGLSALQTKLEETSKAASESQVNAQSGIATVLAFSQMQRKALAGMPFEKERQLLRVLSAQDAQEADRLTALEPLALTGAPTYAALQKGWRKQAAEAQAELRKVGAHTWFDRLIVALEGLVSIRSLNPQAGDMLSFASVDLDLEHGEVLSARQKVQALPPEVQAVLKDWSAQLAMRIDLETKLDQLTAYLIAKGAPEGLVPMSTVEPVAETTPREPESLTVPQQPAASQEKLAEPTVTPEAAPVDAAAPAAAPAESEPAP
ncbi:MAG: hypothetical protein PHW63_04230 [Alphaproteobacteria bacterium]|nr:hypothetical protein [Alphaproteobacteria bacterium]